MWTYDFWLGVGCSVIIAVLCRIVLSVAESQEQHQREYKHMVRDVEVLNIWKDYYDKALADLRRRVIDIECKEIARSHDSAKEVKEPS